VLARREWVNRRCRTFSQARPWFDATSGFSGNSITPSVLGATRPQQDEAPTHRLVSVASLDHRRQRAPHAMQGSIPVPLPSRCPSFLFPHPACPRMSRWAITVICCCCSLTRLSRGHGTSRRRQSISSLCPLCTPSLLLHRVPKNKRRPLKRGADTETGTAGIAFACRLRQTGNVSSVGGAPWAEHFHWPMLRVYCRVRYLHLTCPSVAETETDSTMVTQRSAG
jgi:hypothetical protein